MKFFVTSLFVFCAVPATVFACEGDCIVGITNVFIGNYSSPIRTVMGYIAGQIDQQLIPPSARPRDPVGRYLRPLVAAYDDAVYNTLEKAIFPGFFHGKCLKKGVVPAGCPNPDCPVVCGTPGSLVHFYTKLREIAFTTVRDLLTGLCEPGSAVYQQVEKAVLKDAESAGGRRMVKVRRGSSGPRAIGIRRNSVEDTKASLKVIMDKVPGILQSECGGLGESDEHTLPKCNWERQMKEYILTFP